MTANAFLQVGIYLVVLLALAQPLGGFMARVYDGKPTWLDPMLRPVERVVYRVCGVDPDEGMNWKTYAVAMLLFNAVGMLTVYGIQRCQGALPLNPRGFAGVSPDSAFSTAASFASNTNWQGYGGETTMSYLTQMLALTVQNFVSAAAGMATLVALIRGFRSTASAVIGNFWVDLTRSVLWILLPLALGLALVQVSQGVVQNFSAYRTVPLLAATPGADGTTVTEQTLPMGPASSQIAIKQLGTNGGGFFNVNSAHPYENPTPLSNFVEMLAILLIATALCCTFGQMVGDARQGWAVLAAMTVIFVAMLALCEWAEYRGNPRLTPLGVDAIASDLQPGGNMEGKEVRFGIARSAMFAVSTTATSTGAVNSMHDSFTPLGGFAPLFMMQMSETILGGVGSGLYGMLAFALITVFMAGAIRTGVEEGVANRHVESISSAKPCAIFARISALAGATKTKSADCARSIWAMRLACGSSNTSCRTGLRVRARNVAAPTNCAAAEVKTT